MARTRDMMLVEPGALIRRMFRDFDPWLETRGWFPPALRKSFGEFPWMPALEMTERDRTLLITVDLPGLKKEDVKIEVTHDELTIEGERKLEKEEKAEGLYRTERAYGQFFRRIAIPEHVKAENAAAAFKNGVLEIEMPTIPVPEVKKRTVDIAG